MTSISVKAGEVVDIVDKESTKFLFNVNPESNYPLFTASVDNIPEEREVIWFVPISKC